jgi:hypothetical protein
MTYTTEQVENMLAQVKEFATSNKRCLTEEEIKDMAKSILK